MDMMTIEMKNDIFLRVLSTNVVSDRGLRSIDRSIDSIILSLFKYLHLAGPDNLLDALLCTHALHLHEPRFWYVPPHTPEGRRSAATRHALLAV